MTPPSAPASASEGDVAKGLAGIVAGQTAISSLEGTLRYRGYAIEPLAAAGDFEEVAYLLIHGELPRAAEREAFAARVQAAARTRVSSDSPSRRTDPSPKRACPPPG